MRDCYVFDAVRTPRGRGRAKDGALAEATPLHLAKTVLAALPKRSGFDSAAIEDVILGCVEPVGEQGANIGRLAALASGYDDCVPGMQVNRFCASGLEAVNIGAAKVKAGGQGVWGSIPMPPNGHIKDEDITTLVKWILSGSK